MSVYNEARQHAASLLMQLPKALLAAELEYCHAQYEVRELRLQIEFAEAQAILASDGKTEAHRKAHAALASAVLAKQLLDAEHNALSLKAALQGHLHTLAACKALALLVAGTDE